MPRYWLMKSEPEAYSWDDLEAAGEGIWDGVRNHRAKNNLRAMQPGDKAFFYHSNIGKEIVGIMEVTEAGLSDPTDPDGKWAAVKVAPRTKLPRAVTLQAIKAEPRLADMELLRQSRLSVSEVRSEEWSVVMELAADPGRATAHAGR
ncbi:EVE domain-containing protein [Porphyrobacter sp. GA68]|uniref:EVE domain-containing protein n=1 Tax=Porphyrobacter sp. GA68 TaxID=2883480 RepID=UPI001D196869|nr:EVE domain-containing protein [Porphyrobacter sp. GA68]